jgi:endo-1,4-beta-D-glucanase Y
MNLLHRSRWTLAAAALAAHAAALACGANAPPSAASRPFPQHVTYTAGVIKPTNATQAEMDAAVMATYALWKSTYVKSLGGQGDWVDCGKACGKTDNIAVSEGQGYGMVITAYMGDKTTFDAMYRYYVAHPSRFGPHLMAWQQKYENGKMVDTGGPDSATDGDLDIAYGLLLADRQWGSGGDIDYLQAALDAMHDILAWDVNPAQWNTNPGDWARGSQNDQNHTRPSDWMTDHFVSFAQVDAANADKWNAVYDEVAASVNYQFAHGSGDTGIVPDFMVLSGDHFVPVPGKYLETKHDGDFSYNACRTPWRLAMSYIVDGRGEMLDAQRKTTSWIQSATGAATRKIRAGYYIENGPNGTPFVSYRDLAFTAPMTINAMIGGSASQSWLNSLWTALNGGDFKPVNNYYGDSLRMQVLIVASGNWWTP